MTKAELARELGVGRAYVTMLCNGKKKPSQEMLAKVKFIMSQYVVNNLVNNPAATQPVQLQILAGIDGSRTHRGYRLAPTNGFEVPPDIAELVNTSHVPQIDGHLVNNHEMIELFIKSRPHGLSARTIDFYRGYLLKSIPVLGLTPSPNDINSFLGSLSCSPGGKHAYFRVLRVFYNWLYSPRSGFGFEGRDNPIAWVKAPKRPTVILPSLTAEQVTLLINTAESLRDKAIIALFAESGLRLAELVNIKPTDIDWQSRTIRVLGKGNKEGYAPFGSLSEQYLRAWFSEFHPDGGNIWGLTKWQVISMLQALREETGLPCNPHTFRRTFACLLRKAGVDSLTIKDLGRWESLEMVQRYTRSVTFEDSLRHYKAPLG